MELKLSREDCLEYENIRLRIALQEEKIKHLDSIISSYEEKSIVILSKISATLAEHDLSLDTVDINFKTGLVTPKVPVPTTT